MGILNTVFAFFLLSIAKANKVNQYKKTNILFSLFWSTKLSMGHLQKGSKKPYTKNSPEIYLFELNYIELPLSLNYEIKKGIYIESGVGTAFLVGYKEQDEMADINTENPNLLALDFLLGVQYQFKKHLKLNIRYSNSITPIRKHASEEEWGLNKGQYSSLVSFAFMYQISR